MEHNPYEPLQQKIRNEMKILLSRSRKGTTEAEWEACMPDLDKRKKLQLRLCTEGDGEWKWKDDIVDVEMLIKRAPNAESIGLVKIFKRTASVSNGRFKYLALPNRVNLLKPPSPIEDHIFGFDIIIRPMPTAGFNSEVGDARPSMHIGSLSFCVVIHCPAIEDDGGVIKLDVDNSIIRPVCGDQVSQYDIVNKLLNSITTNEYNIRQHLKNHEWPELTLALTTCANKATASVAMY